MQGIVLSLLVLISGVLAFEQNDFKWKFERGEVFSFNKEYVRDFKIITHKYNRTTAVVNATFTYTRDLGRNIQVILQATKFMSNEYRYFPIRFQFGFCDAAEKNEFGLGGFYNCGNFTKCPVAKGKYFICNWAPDGSRFPPHVPNGRYRFDLQVLHREIEIMELRFAMEIYRPFVKK